MTLAFVDLASSTDLSTQLDPEDFRNFILAYQDAVTTVVDRYDGYVARFIGDGVLVYFGYPKAHENDAERAVRAALDIIDVVSAIDLEKYPGAPESTSVRIGVTTGPCVVGDIVGHDSAQESTALGETPNIAARLQSTANPNELVVGETTHHIVEGLFEFEDLGKLDLKGVGRPVQSYRVRGATEAVNRFDRSLRLGLSQLIGRQPELEKLQKAWTDTTETCGGVAVIGETGIGKSRLIHEFCTGLAQEQAVLLRGHCVIGGETLPLHPFVEIVRTAFQIRERDVDPSDKLVRGLEMLGLPVDEHLPYLLNLLGRTPESLRDLPVELLGARTQLTLQKLLRARCSRSRVLLNIEDLHWTDRSSEELLDWILQQRDLPGLLVLMSYRPTYRPSWSHMANVQSLELSPLSSGSTSELIKLRLGGDVPKQVVGQVSVKSEGNPLFAEELANYLLHSGHQVTAGEAMPANLESLLLDRIDRLETDAKKVLQAASVVGRHFSVDRVARIAKLNGELVPNLAILETQDLVFAESAGSRFRFKHALVHDVVYHNLLRADRKALHQRLAQSLEVDYADWLNEVVDEIADHYSYTDRLDKTVSYLEQAGEKSLALYSLDAAKARFTAVLELMREHPGCADDTLLARVLLRLARVYYFQYEFKALIELVHEYLPRIEALGDGRILSRFLFETGYAHVFGARQDIGRPLLERALEVAESNSDDEGIGYASMGLMWHHAFWGVPGPSRKAEVERLGARAIEIGRRLGDVWLVTKAVLAYTQEHTLWGQPAEVVRWDEELSRIASETDDPRPLGMSLFRRAFGAALRDDFDAGIDYAEEALRTSISPIDRAYGQLSLAFCQLLSGNLEESSDALVRLRSDMENKGMIIPNFFAIKVPYSFMLLMSGEPAQAVRHLTNQMHRFEALGQATATVHGSLYLGQIHAILATSKERPSWPTVRRNLGFMLTTIPFADRRARSYLQRACDEARRLDCPGVELSSLIQLIHLHRAKGRERDGAACFGKAREIAGSMGVEWMLEGVDADKTDRAQ